MTEPGACPVSRDEGRRFSAAGAEAELQAAGLSSQADGWRHLPALPAGRPNQEVFAETLLEAARRDPTILVVTSDSRGSARLAQFANELPDRIVEVGIAEQNVVGIGAGLAAAGHKVFAVSPACFLTTRALEQIKNDVAYSGHKVVLVGISAGVSYGALGSTHHSLNDLASLRALHNVDIVVPADNRQTREAVLAALDHPRPLYLRFGKRPVPELPAGAGEFSIGRGECLAGGTDAALVATGEAVWRALAARSALAEDGIFCQVLSMHSIRPFDGAALLEAARSVRAMVCIEEHSVHGGLGEQCAALLMQEGVRVPYRIMGIPDEYMVTGSQEEILSHYGISATGIAGEIRRLLGGTTWQS